MEESPINEDFDIDTPDGIVHIHFDRFEYELFLMQKMLAEIGMSLEVIYYESCKGEDEYNGYK